MEKGPVRVSTGGSKVTQGFLYDHAANVEDNGLGGYF